MSFTSKQIEDALKKVKHPGMGKDIISLQMVRDIRIEGNKIGFSLVFEKSNDPFISSIRKACVKAIRTYLGPDADASGGIVVKAVQMIEP